MKDFFETFHSVNEFITTIGKRPQTDGMGTSSTDRGSDRTAWTGTESYEQACNLALYGDAESRDKVQKSLIKLRNTKAATEQRSQARVVRSVMGSRPCVPAAIIGQPNSMYRRHTVRVNKPVVTVFYSMSACSRVSADTIINVGAKVAEAIQIAEHSGVRVNLYAGVTAKEYGYENGKKQTERIAMFVRIKDSAKDFDLLRMAYVLVNPSFLRRHYFKFLETLQGITASRWDSSYGKPLDRDEESKLQDALAGQHIKTDYLLTYNNICNKSAEDIARIITGQAKI